MSLVRIQSDAEEKAKLTEQFRQLWTKGEVDVPTSVPAGLESTPARPKEVVMVEAKKVKQGSK